MARCRGCGIGEIRYDDATRLGRCPYCGFTYVKFDVNVPRQKAIGIISDNAKTTDEKVDALMEEGDALLNSGRYPEALDKYQIAECINAYNLMAMAARLKVFLCNNPDRTIYECASDKTARAIMLCLESMATDEDYTWIEKKYGMDLRIDRFEYWYDGVKDDFNKFASLKGGKGYTGDIANQMAKKINQSLRHAWSLANTEDQKQKLVDLCDGRDMLIVDNMVCAYLGYVNGKRDALIPDGVRYIFTGTFSGCEFGKVYIPSSMLLIDTYAFEKTKIDELFIDSVGRGVVASIGEYAFSGSKIKHINADASVSKKGSFRFCEIGDASFGFINIIGTGAFASSKIGRMSIMAVDDILDRAFEQSDIGSIEIGILISVGETPFVGSTGNVRVRSPSGLESVMVKGSNINYTEGGNIVRTVDLKERIRVKEEIRHTMKANKPKTGLISKFGSMFRK